MGVADLLAFELLDPPPRGALLRALLDLHAIAALDDAGGLTALGRRISRLPVEPRLGAALAAAERLGCVDEVATIAAMLSGEEPFARDGARAAGAAAGAADGRESVALARARLGARDVSARVDVYSSDHLFLLALDCAFAAALAAGAPAAQRWAADWGVLPRAMHAAREVRAQLIGLVARGRAAGAPSGTSDGHAEPLGARVRRAICAGYFAHAVRRVGAGGDVCVPLAPAAGAAGSALLHPLPQSACVLAGGHSLFVYHSLSAASGGVHMRNVCQVERDWLEPPLRRLRQPVDPLVLAGAQPALVATAPVGKRVRGGGPDGGAGGDGGCAAAAVGAARSDDARARADAARARFLKRRGVDDGTE
jgi:ATP-dependent RNA helicase DHX8/PRP22